MSGSSRWILRLGLVHLGAILALAGCWIPVAGNDGSQYQVAIVVLPPAGEVAPPSPGATRTVSAQLLVGPSMPGNEEASIALAVRDERGSDEGWTVKIMQPAGDAGPALLRGYRERVEPGIRTASTDEAGPQGDRLAVGQPLSRLTPVIVAEPGTAGGTYLVGLELATSRDPVPTAPLVVSLSSAP